MGIIPPLLEVSLSGATWFAPPCWRQSSDDDAPNFQARVRSAVATALWRSLPLPPFELEVLMQRTLGAPPVLDRHGAG